MDFIDAQIPPFWGGISVNARASVSRILSWIAIYLVPRSPSGSSGTSRESRDTALHSSKDLAVSPPCFLRQGTRLCSHLFCPHGANDRGYLLLIFAYAKRVFGLSSPAFAEATTQRALHTITQFCSLRQRYAALQNPPIPRVHTAQVVLDRNF